MDGFHRKKDDLKKSLVPDDIDEEEDDPYGEKEADMRLGKKRVRAVLLFIYTHIFFYVFIYG